MTRRSGIHLVLSGCLVAVALLLAACSNSSSPSSNPLPPATSVVAPGASVPFDPSNNARADVSSGTCKESPEGWVLDGTVKNPGNEDKSFQIVVDFVSRPGSTVLGTTVISVRRVPPGRSTNWTAVGAKGKSGVACVIRLAQSL